MTDTYMKKLVEENTLPRDGVKDIMTKCCYAARQTAQGSKSLIPMLEVHARRMIVNEADNTISLGDVELHLFALAVPFNERDDKRAVLRGVALDLRAKWMVPFATFLIAEAWAATVPEGQPYVQPRHHPQKREIILVAGMTLDRINMMATADVTRDSSERMTVSEFSEISEAGISSSLLVEFYASLFGK